MVFHEYIYIFNFLQTDFFRLLEAFKDFIQFFLYISTNMFLGNYWSLQKISPHFYKKFQLGSPRIEARTSFGNNCSNVFLMYRTVSKSFLWRLLPDIFFSYSSIKFFKNYLQKNRSRLLFTIFLQKFSRIFSQILSRVSTEKVYWEVYQGHLSEIQVCCTLPIWLDKSSTPWVMIWIPSHNSSAIKRLKIQERPLPFHWVWQLNKSKSSLPFSNSH